MTETIVVLDAISETVAERLRALLPEGFSLTHGAAVDVYEIEPLPADSPLPHVDNLTLTPHLGAMAADTFAPTVRRMFENIARVSRGEAIPALDVVVDQARPATRALTGNRRPARAGVDTSNSID